MSAALALVMTEAEPDLPYHFVYLDERGAYHSTGRYLFADDESARVHARRLLAGASVVVIYQGGRKIGMIANLC